MDIYKTYINKVANDQQTVRIGRLSAAVALVVASVMAPLLGGIDQAFQYIQEYTGVVSPGILAVFMLGLFWKKATNSAAIIGAIASIPIALGLKFMTGLPWMHQMGLTAIFTMVIIAVVSLVGNQGQDDKKGIPLPKGIFGTGPIFNISAFAVMIICAVLYALFW